MPVDLPDPLVMVPFGAPIDASITVPGSKSITNRALVCAALASGPSVLQAALFADDTEAMVGVVRALGIRVETDPNTERMVVQGAAGELPAVNAALDVRQSGTTARFALPLVALGRGSYRITGHPQMQARPMGPTFDALRAMGVPIEEQAGAGRLPATVRGGLRPSGAVRISGDQSSQFISGLLLVGPCLPDGLILEVTTPLVSRPYVELTMAVMASFGAHVESPDSSTFVVLPGGYVGTDYRIEPDASAASYPLAAAAMCGGRVRVEGLGAASLQGDARFADVLAEMGAVVTRDDTGVTIVGDGRPRGGTFDLTHISDTAQTLAMVAVFADRPVRIEGIGFIRGKETDRVAAVATELARCGVDVVEDADGWLITPGRLPQPTVVRTYDDHRMAMSFALLGLRCPGIAIADPGCVAKTFPGYFDLVEQLRPRAVPAASPLG